MKIEYKNRLEFNREPAPLNTPVLMTSFVMKDRDTNPNQCYITFTSNDHYVRVLINKMYDIELYNYIVNNKEKQFWVTTESYKSDKLKFPVIRITEIEAI